MSKTKALSEHCEQQCIAKGLVEVRTVVRAFSDTVTFAEEQFGLSAGKWSVTDSFCALRIASHCESGLQQKKNGQKQRSVFVFCVEVRVWAPSMHW